MLSKLPPICPTLAIVSYSFGFLWCPMVSCRFAPVSLCFPTAFPMCFHVFAMFVRSSSDTFLMVPMCLLCFSYAFISVFLCFSSALPTPSLCFLVLSPMPFPCFSCAFLCLSIMFSFVCFSDACAMLFLCFSHAHPLFWFYVFLMIFE